MSVNGFAKLPTANTSQQIPGRLGWPDGRIWRGWKFEGFSCFSCFFVFFVFFRVFRVFRVFRSKFMISGSGGQKSAGGRKSGIFWIFSLFVSPPRNRFFWSKWKKNPNVSPPRNRFFALQKKCEKSTISRGIDRVGVSFGLRHGRLFFQKMP